MATTAQRPKLIVIVGPTATGKSDLAMRIAREVNGEIIAADSRTVYEGMDIGTAKPTKKDQLAVPHHLLDMIEPNGFFTAADFQKSANKAIEKIKKRGNLPLLVGGSGLYIDSVLFNFKFAPKADEKLHSRLEAMTVEELKKYAMTHDVFLGGIERNNKRHLVRAIERGGMVEQRLRLRRGGLIIGIRPQIDVLKARIERRVEQMIEDGFITEANRLATKYGWEYEANTIYSTVREYENGNRNIEDIKNELVKKHLGLAKRQLTWFKRNKFIHWFETPEQAYNYIKSQLNT